MDLKDFINLFNKADFISERREGGWYLVYFPVVVDNIGFVGILHFKNSVLQKTSVMISMPTDEEAIGIISYGISLKNDTLDIYEELKTEVGAKVPLLIDNLNEHRKEWNRLLQFEPSGKMLWLKKQGYFNLTTVEGTVLM